MTDQKKANKNEPINPEIKALEEKKAKIDAKIALLKEKERKLDARRKILAGGWLLALARTDESIQELLENRFYPTLKDDKDRVLFKRDPVNEKTKSQDGHSKILVQFPGGKPTDEVLVAMKAAGKAWKWNGPSQTWTGEADPEAVRNAVDPVAVEIREA